MLRDPHHDLNIFAFRDFVALQAKNGSFDYQFRRVCACGKFAKHIGLFNEWMACRFAGDISPWSQLDHLARECYFKAQRPGQRVRWSELLARIDYEIAGLT